LRYRLTLIFLGLAVVPLLVLGLIVGRLIYRNSELQSLALHDEIADNVANRIEAFVQGVSDQLVFLDEVLRLGTRVTAGQELILANLLFQHSVYQEITLVDSDGLETVRLSRSETYTQADLGSRADQVEFSEPMGTGQIYYAAIRFDPVIREPLATISVPLWDKRTGEIVATLVADVRFRAIWSLLGQIDRPAHEEVYVTDANGRMVAHSDPSVVLSGTVVQIPADGRGGGILGPSAVSAVRPIVFGAQTLITVVEVPLSDVFATALDGLGVALIVTAVAVLAAITLILIATRSIVRPIVWLTASARALSLSTASLSEIALPGPSMRNNYEVAALIDSFNLMSRAVREREQDLHQAHEGLELRVAERTAELEVANEQVRSERDRAQMYMDLASVMIVALDREGTVMLINKTGAQMLGVAEDEIIGESFGRFVHPDDLDAARNNLRRRISGDQSNAEPQERRLITATGEIRLIAWHTTILRDEAGNISGLLNAGEDITTRREMKDERERLIAQLESKNAELERFAYTVSHDLKSPLITIGGFLGYVERSMASGDVEQARADLARIFDATNRMKSLLDAVLDLSRIGGAPARAQVVELGPLAREVVEMLDGQLALGAVKVEIAPNLPAITGDGDSLRRVLENLVDNAVKYRGDQVNPVVQIGCEWDEENLVVFVRDNGNGIDPRYQQKVFQLFQRLDHTTEGTGVGLATVKRIVEVHGGRVWVESEGRGKGSTFRFSIPATRPGDRRLPARRNK
jgi:PAS domain S-box-containing protein